MKILISGCSFTSWPEYPGGPNVCWPKYFEQLNPQHEIRCVAEPAAGNQYIADSVVRSVLEFKPDHVLVMWTGVSRLDFLTSLEDPAWERMYDSYGFYRRVDQCPNDLGYIFSGGRQGTWFAHGVAEKMFREMYMVSNNLSLGSINLMEMVKTQHFLRSKNIPYHFMSYVNYWNSDEWVSQNGDFGVYHYPELRPLINDIDFEPWIFTDAQKNGIYEMAVKADSYYLDRFHPGLDIQAQWAEIVNRRFQKAYPVDVAPYPLQI